MFKHIPARPWKGAQIVRSAISLTLIFLLIEFFDELHYGIQSAVLPYLRLDLNLDYAQIGLLLGLPAALNTLIEPALMLLGDTRLRKRLVVGGGLAVIIAVLLIATAASFTSVLLAFIIAFPASGAFVSLSQATLMDLNPGREPHSMARWTVAGSLGNLCGPILVAVGFALGVGWRWTYWGLALLALGLVLTVLLKPFPARRLHLDSTPSTAASLAVTPAETTDMGEFRMLLPNLRQALRKTRTLRWLALLQMSDLLLDIFTGYAALYYADVVGLRPAQVALVMTALMVASLASDMILIPLLERLPGRSIVRTSAVLAVFVYPAWLLAPWPLVKIILGPAVRLTTLGWYPVLQGELFASLPGRSGTVNAISSLAGLVSGGLAWLIGWVASQAGLPAAMWILLLAPFSLALFVPRAEIETG
jgi:FSR family fosmidomycin resistance protein-like MFS transporter